MENVIETNHITKQYGKKTVLNDVSMHVKKGEIYGFVGPNGAGKSTLMKVLLNLEQAETGEVRLFQEHNPVSMFERLKRIGSIIEQPYFYEHLSAQENLALHCAYMGYHDTQEISHVLSLVGLKQAKDQRVSQFSMGMKQRLAIARAILTKPELLILDEPINALDPEGIKEMRDLFRNFNQSYGTTILISSHILSEVEQIAHTIGILQEGTLLEEVAMDQIHQFQNDYLELCVDAIDVAAYVLEHVCHWKAYKVISDTTIELYEQHISVKELTKCLVEHGVGIDQITQKQHSLESYFFQAVSSGGKQ